MAYTVVFRKSVRSDFCYARRGMLGVAHPIDVDAVAVDVDVVAKALIQVTVGEIQVIGMAVEVGKVLAVEAGDDNMCLVRGALIEAQ